MYMKTRSNRIRHRICNGIFCLSILGCPLICLSYFTTNIAFIKVLIMLFFILYNNYCNGIGQ